MAAADQRAGPHYQPGMPRFIDDGELFNVWGRLGVQAKKGDVQALPAAARLHLQEEVCREAAEMKQWFLQCALPIKEPRRETLHRCALVVA